MKIEFKNGSKLEVISDKTSKRPAYIHTWLLSYPLLEIFTDLKWYQKIYMKIICRISNIKPTLWLKKCSCLNCGKKIKYPKFYVASRACGKPIIEMARSVRYLCCSNECFYEYWRKLWKDNNYEEWKYRKNHIGRYCKIAVKAEKKCLLDVNQK